jgi:hypothetical protein
LHAIAATFLTFRACRSAAARRVSPIHRRKPARARLEARYPFLQRLSEGKLRNAYERAQLYRLEPECIVLIENQSDFGSKEVLEFEA